MSIAIVTGSLSPYSARLYDAFAERTGETLHVLTCAAVEPQRAWQVPPPRHYNLEVLPGLRWHRDYVSHLYLNPSVAIRLRQLRPDVVALGAFSPTMALAALYCRLSRTPYGVATDGTLATDPGERSRPHRLMRRAIVPKAQFGICASEASVALLERWGLPEGRGVVVPIVPAWAPPRHLPGFGQRPFDVILAGAIEDRFKGVRFFADVIDRMAAGGRRLRVRVTGDGPLRGELASRLAAAGVEAHFDGAVQPAAMAAALASAKLLMFPSRQDAWGLVANEAVLCGTPVLGSPHATSSEHFVERFGVGLVRPLDVEAWALAAEGMLASEARWQGYMMRRGEALAWCSLDGAVQALRDAFELGRGTSPGPASPAPGLVTQSARGG